jgi:hypothetical protein
MTRKKSISKSTRRNLRNNEPNVKLRSTHSVLRMVSRSKRRAKISMSLTKSSRLDRRL